MGNHHVTPDGHVTEAFSELMLQFAEGPGVRLSEQRIRLYAHALGDVPLDVVRSRGGRVLQRERRFPFIADLRGETGEDDAALVAWAALNRAASRVGGWASLEVEDEAAAVALLNVFGSWPAFCEMEDGPALAQRRQEFLACYRRAMRRVTHRRAEPRRLPGICEQQSGVVPAGAEVGRLTEGGDVLSRRAPRELAAGKGVVRAALPEAAQGKPQAGDGAAPPRRERRRAPRQAAGGGA